MQHLKEGVKETQCGVICCLVDRLAIFRFDHFKIPAGKFVPEQAVYSHQSLAYLVHFKEFVHLSVDFFQLGVKPFNSNLVHFGLGFFSSLPTLNETESVPYLIVEVTTLFAQTFIKENIITGRSGEHHTHTHTVSTIFLNEHDRIRGITETLAHLSAKFVTYDTCEINMLERHLASVFITCHNHAGYPEENDIRTGNEVTCRIIIVYFIIVRLVYSVKHGDRPEP